MFDFQLIINLEDINNYSPAFPVEVYVSTDIPENARVGDTVLECKYIKQLSPGFFYCLFLGPAEIIFSVLKLKLESFSGSQK